MYGGSSLGVFLLFTTLIMAGESKYHKRKRAHQEVIRGIRHHHSPQVDPHLDLLKNPEDDYVSEAENLQVDREMEREKGADGANSPTVDGSERWSQQSKNDQNLCPVTSCNSDFQMSIVVRLKQIQDQFLKETGLDRPPNMTGVVISENPYLQSLIHHTNSQDSVTFKHKREHPEDVAYSDDPNSSIRNEKVFIAASRDNRDFFRLPEGDVIIYFNLTKEHISNIEFAYLHLWLRPSSSTDSGENIAAASIYKIEASPFHEYPRFREYYGDLKVPYKRGGAWVKMDIYLLARDWIFYPENNYGLSISLSTLDNKHLTFDTAADDPAHAPLLELDVVEERNDRRKRYASNRICTDRKIEKICCRYPLIVNFVDFQWDFIVAPKRYEANYCRGDCPFVFAQKYPHSTLLQKKFNSTNSTHGPCCGARVLDPLRMVYYDGAKIKVSVIKDMVVKQCSCT